MNDSCMRLKTAVVQMNSTTDKSANVAQALDLCERAIQQGAEFIVLPEVFNIRSTQLEICSQAETLDGLSLSPFKIMARDHQVAILAGSITESITSSAKCYNTSAFIGADGLIHAIYRKMHLFDCDLGDKQILESSVFEAGQELAMATLHGIPIGMSICYDVRFPELYRYYSQRGARILCIPASFTAPTGEAHWEVLLRARAIENLCYVLAPNQAGIGSSGVPTYGNSMIIDPWGKVIARASFDQPEVLFAELDFVLQDEVRKKLPALAHRRI